MQNPWWKSAIIYEVYVDKFAQDFKGLAGKLEYLKNLGINCIWILPHHPSPMDDDGYDVSDYYNVRPELGSLDDFKNFTSKAHEMGIKVMVDFVLNHVSTRHPWFIEAAGSANNSKRDFFVWSKSGKEFPDAINPFSHIKSSNWISRGDQYYFATFYPSQADLNWDNPEVFREMMKIIDFWIANGVDGFRLDAAPFLIKREGTECVSLPETHQVLKRIRSYVDLKNPEIALMAESNGTLEQIKTYFGEGDECHMAFNFHLMAALFQSLKEGNRSKIDQILKESANIPENCQWVNFLRNHDELTLRYVNPEERKELLKWLDPDGKYLFKSEKGTSMRLAEIFSGNKEKILEAFRLLLSCPGIPVIYYGDEIGMRNLNLPEKPADSRRYVRGQFDWQEAEKQAKDPDSIYSQLAESIKNRP